MPSCPATARSSRSLASSTLPLSLCEWLARSWAKLWARCRSTAGRGAERLPIQLLAAIRWRQVLDGPQYQPAPAAQCL